MIVLVVTCRVVGTGTAVVPVRQRISLTLQSVSVRLLLLYCCIGIVDRISSYLQRKPVYRSYEKSDTMHEV